MKKEITCTELAEILGIEKAQRGRNSYHCWRKQNHKNGDRNPSLVIYEDRWKCEVCDNKYQNYYDLVYEFNNFNDKDVFDKSIATENWLRDNGFWEQRNGESKESRESLMPICSPQTLSKRNSNHKIQIRRIHKSELPNEEKYSNRNEWLQEITPSKNERFLYVSNTVKTHPPTKDDILRINSIYEKRLSKYSLSKAKVEVCELNGWFCLAYKYYENKNKQMIYNPNKIKDRVLHFEGRSDWLSAIELELYDQYSLVSEFNATNKVMINDNDSVVRLFVIDNDVDVKDFKNRIHCKSKKSLIHYLKVPEEYNDFAEWVYHSKLDKDYFQNWILDNWQDLPIEVGQNDIDDNIAGRANRIEKIFEKCYDPNYDNKPPHNEPTLFLNDVRVGSPGNITALVSGSGYGKSSVCEAILASFLNDNVDALGFSVGNIQHVTYLDTERTKPDHWHSWQRTLRRAEVPYSEMPENYIFRNISLIPSIDERNQLLDYFLDNPFSNMDLLLLDNLTDFLYGVNDEKESNELLYRISAKAKNSNVTLFITIHSNPQPSQTKARGHIGSEIIRRSESVILLQRDFSSEQRTLTTKFNEGKNRNDTDNIESYFRFDESRMMYVSCDNTVKKKRKTKIDDTYLQTLLEKTLSKDDSMSINTFKEKIKKVENCSERTVASRYRDMIKRNLIHVNGERVIACY